MKAVSNEDGLREVLVQTVTDAEKRLRECKKEVLQSNLNEGDNRKDHDTINILIGVLRCLHDNKLFPNEYDQDQQAMVNLLQTIDSGDRALRKLEANKHNKHVLQEGLRPGLRESSPNICVQEIMDLNDTNTGAPMINQLNDQITNLIPGSLETGLSSAVLIIFLAAACVLPQDWSCYTYLSLLAVSIGIWLHGYMYGRRSASTNNAAEQGNFNINWTGGPLVDLRACVEPGAVTVENGAVQARMENGAVQADARMEKGAVTMKADLQANMNTMNNTAKLGCLS